MLIFTLPIAIITGVLIGKFYQPESKLHKLLMAFLVPIISGFVINIIIASANYSGGNLWFDYGRYFVFVAIPELALFITLLIALKVMHKDKTETEELSIQTLHYGTSEDKVVFEVQLSKKELAKMDELRKQDPNKWKDNDYELVKEAKRQLELKVSEKEEEKKEENTDNGNLNNPIVLTELSTPKLQKVELEQNGITVTMELSKEIIEQMAVLRQESPQKWIDNEVELVKAAKRRTQGISDEEEPKKSETFSTVETPMNPETSSDHTADIQSPKGIFGNKLESEYRRETKADSHWIRQDDTEICISIEDDVYRKMVEMQNENPKKWVNKELDLYQKAKKALLDPKSKSRKLFN